MWAESRKDLALRALARDLDIESLIARD